MENVEVIVKTEFFLDYENENSSSNYDFAFQHEESFPGNSNNECNDNDTQRDPSDTPKKAFPCSFCPRSYNYRRGLEEHIKLKHACKEIPKQQIVANIKRTRKKKIAVRDPKLEFQCPLCGNGLSKLSKLTRHIQLVHILNEEEHQGGGRIQCFMCPEFVFSATDLLNHIKHIHGGTPKSVEDEDSFEGQAEISPVKVGVKTFDCSDCSKSFDTKKGLLTHRIHKHRPSRFNSKRLVQQQETPMIEIPKIKQESFEPEDVYEDVFTAEEDLNAASYCQIPSNDTTNEERDPLEIRKKAHPCKFCPKSYYYRRGLEEHIKLKHAVKEIPIQTPLPRIKLNSEKEMVVRDPSIPFQCPLCGTGLSKLAKLCRHIQIVHLLNGQEYFQDEKGFDIQCFMCPQYVSTATDLLSHIKNFHGNTRKGMEERVKILIKKIKVQSQVTKVECRMCKRNKIVRKFNSQQDLQRHIQKRHQQQQQSSRYKCKICSLAFPNLLNLVRHKASHYEVVVKPEVFEPVEVEEEEVEMNPEIVEMQDDYQNSFSSHTFELEPQATSSTRSNFESAETEDTAKTIKAFPCKFCPRSYNYRRGLEEHIKIKHAYKEVPKHQLLARRKRTRKKKIAVRDPSLQFQCPLCGNGLSKLYKLTRHIQLVHILDEEEHQGESRIQCFMCPELFSTATDILSHIRQNHGGTQEPVDDEDEDVLEGHVEISGKGPVRKFKCKECSTHEICRTFDTKKGLLIHRSHLHKPS